MSKSKEQLLKEFDKRQKELRDEFIAKLDNDREKFKPSLPDRIDEAYIIDVDGKVILFDTLKYDDEECFAQGSIFFDKDEAELVARERRLIFKIREWAKIKNQNWKPGWNDANESKYHVYYDFDTNELDISCCYVSRIIDRLPYFKLYRIANECIEEFGDEIVEILI